MSNGITRIINRLLPSTVSWDDIAPECPRCYQRLESKKELDLNLNPRSLCVDCLAYEESLYNFEVA
jgi:hypothetical protein